MYKANAMMGDVLVLKTRSNAPRKFSFETGTKLILTNEAGCGSGKMTARVVIYVMHKKPLSTVQILKYNSSHEQCVVSSKGSLIERSQRAGIVWIGDDMMRKGKRTHIMEGGSRVEFDRPTLSLISSCLSLWHFLVGRCSLFSEWCDHEILSHK